LIDVLYRGNIGTVQMLIDVIYRGNIGSVQMLIDVLHRTVTLALFSCQS